MNIPFLIAAGLGLLIACIHTFAGSRTDVRPLLDSDLPEPARSTLYYCWHIVTIVLFTMAGMFAWSGLHPDENTPAILATVLSTAFAVWGFAIVSVRKRSPLTELPQGLMFLLLSGAGLWGLLR